MRLLIITRDFDVHALCVATAMACLGHRVVVWCEPHRAGDAVASLYFDADGGAEWRMNSKSFAQSEFDLVWMRRHDRIDMPQWMDSRDRPYAQQENNAFFRWIWGALGQHARWVHSLPDYINSEAKIVQIRVANEIGFDFPPTLFSNDPQEIRSFLRDCGQAGAGGVYKTFYPMAWDEPEVVRPMHTRPVEEADFDDDENIKAVPGIYQRRVEKRYEVRSTFFGDAELSAKIDSQRSSEGREDWRDIGAIEDYLSAYRLPVDVYEKCRAYMKALSLDIACFDFIVDRDGRHLFLEANQQGQFLWVEECVPGLQMLEEACRLFLALSGERMASGDVDFMTMPAVTRTPLYKRMEERLLSARFLDTLDFTS